jgi:hypothetical protein
MAMGGGCFSPLAVKLACDARLLQLWGSPLPLVSTAEVPEEGRKNWREKILSPEPGVCEHLLFNLMY